jgi:hypothetical protein
MGWKVGLEYRDRVHRHKESDCGRWLQDRCLVHVYVVYAHEVHAHEVHAHEVYAREMHAHEVHACEMHVYEVHTHEMLSAGIGIVQPFALFGSSTYAY